MVFFQLRPLGSGSSEVGQRWKSSNLEAMTYVEGCVADGVGKCGSSCVWKCGSWWQGDVSRWIGRWHCVDCDGSGRWDGSDHYVSVLFNGYDDYKVMKMMVMRPKGFVDSNVVFADGNVVFADGNVLYVTVLIGMAGLSAIMMILCWC